MSQSHKNYEKTYLVWFIVTSLFGGPGQSMPTYSEVDGQHDFSIVESPDPSRACGGKGSGCVRLEITRVFSKTLGLEHTFKHKHKQERLQQRLWKP